MTIATKNYPFTKKCPKCKQNTLLRQSFESNYICSDSNCNTVLVSEGAIVTAIKNDFESRHYTVLVDESQNPDITCSKDAELWHIEAKGESANETVDFHTVLGQLLRKMKGDLAIFYAIALPDTPKYRKKCKNLSSWLRDRLHLYLILVREQNLKCISPNEEI